MAGVWARPLIRRARVSTSSRMRLVMALPGLWSAIPMPVRRPNAQPTTELASGWETSWNSSRCRANDAVDPGLFWVWCTAPGGASVQGRRCPACQFQNTEFWCPTPAASWPRGIAPYLPSCSTCGVMVVRMFQARRWRASARAQLRQFDFASYIGPETNLRARSPQSGPWPLINVWLLGHSTVCRGAYWVACVVSPRSLPLPECTMPCIYA